MKEYYYLDINRKVQGPHKPEELAGMLKAGTLAPDTEVAGPGDARWVPLGSLVTPEQVDAAKLPPIPGLAGAPGKCPSCAAELQMVDGVLPPCCPQCGRVLRSVRGGFWGNFLLPFSQYAKFSGRATRAEYWIFTLLFSVLMYGLFIVGLMMVFYAALMREVPEQFEAGMLVALGGFVLVALIVVIPLVSVQVRRLHDVGFSGWWLGAAWLCNLVYVVGLQVVCREEYEHLGQVVEQSIKSGDKNWLQALQLAMDSPVTPLMTAFGIFNLVSQMLFLMVFVLSFLDSQRGPNKYGPSRKYPMG